MAAHNNDNIVMVYYEDLPDEDKDTISKATEEFQKKCLLSTKTRDNIIVQKFPLPRVLLHGYEDEEEEVAMTEWNWGKKIVMVPNPWGRGVEESYDFDVMKSQAF